jgi:Flp pilus assembly protein TadD
MRKSIIYTFSIVVACTTAVLFVSACTFFRGQTEEGYVLKGKDAAKFIGSIRAHSGNAEQHYDFGCHLQVRKKHKLAIAEFQKALESVPNLAKAYNALGVSYDALGEYAMAVESYQNALKIESNLHNVLNNLGYSYLLQDNPAMAIECFKKAVDLDKDNELYHNNLGLAYAKHGQFDAAYDEFRKTGDEAKAHYNIAQLYYQNGFYKEAKEHFAAANNVEPKAERAFKASESLDEILFETAQTPGRPADTSVEAPVIDIIYADAERAHTIPADIPDENITGNGQTELEEPDERLAAVPAVEVVYYDSDGIGTIPSDALKSSKVNVTPPAVSEKAGPDYPGEKDAGKIVTAAFLQADTRIGRQEGSQTVTEENEHVIFNEANAAQMLKLKTAGTENRPAPRLKIEVKNGNGVNRMARRVGNFLSSQDVILMYLSNADHFNHKWSRIYYTSGYLREACQLAQKLPGLQTLEEVSSIRGGNAEISILIGTDLIPSDTLFAEG